MGLYLFIIIPQVSSSKRRPPRTRIHAQLTLGRNPPQFDPVRTQGTRQSSKNLCAHVSSLLFLVGSVSQMYITLCGEIVCSTALVIFLTLAIKEEN